MPSIRVVYQRVRGVLAEWEARGTCGLTVYVKFKNGGLFDRELSGLGAFQNLVNVGRRAPEEHRPVGSIRQQTARLHKFLEAIPN
jgi:hypothetical protein